MSKTGRAHIRFEADAKTFVSLRFDDASVIGGIAITESQGGCSGAFLANQNLFAGTICELELGHLDAVQAEIRWVEKLDQDLVKVGFQYMPLES